MLCQILAYEGIWLSKTKEGTNKQF